MIMVGNNWEVDGDGKIIKGNAPIYDSGWAEIAQNETKTFTHNLGGDPDNYLVVVEGWRSDLDIHNIGIGSRIVAANYEGVYYKNLNNTSIKTYRNAADVAWVKVRVRIWKYS